MVINTLEAANSKMVCKENGMDESAFIGKLSSPNAPPVFVHADAHCLVVEKPPGLLCVPGRGADKQDCLSARVQAVYPDALIVHRLDMATSGLWLMASGHDAQRRLSRAFDERAVSKHYVAVVDGQPQQSTPEQEWSVIDLPLAADWPNRPRQKVDYETGKSSLTRWRILAKGATSSRLELQPVTGRSHQLRVHLLALGHCIVGDALYAPPHIAAAAPRLLLHASGLRFEHPSSGQSIAFTSPAPF